MTAIKRFGALLLCAIITLAVSDSAFTAEIYRSGIQSIARGQTEAAQTIGLTYAQTMRYVILPQAIRAAVPSMGNQYLNITKNTSIALAVGYSDLVSVMTTSISFFSRMRCAGAPSSASKIRENPSGSSPRTTK